MLSYLWNYFNPAAEPTAGERTKGIVVTKNRRKPYNQFEILETPRDFYFLSLLKEDDSKWSIHGLWPQYSLNQYPKFCRDVEFDLNKLDPIMSRLKDEWYSNRGPDEVFWKHEYLKHGTCNFNNFNELQYFKTTLDLFDKAVSLQLPEQYFNSETNKCLIPVNKNLQFFKIN
tara:strand:+ start:155 stop:670 length:516 start_codon:yes stop_codon:yes gene_type:complete